MGHPVAPGHPPPPAEAARGATRRHRETARFRRRRALAAAALEAAALEALSSRVAELLDCPVGEEVLPNVHCTQPGPGVPEGSSDSSGGDAEERFASGASAAFPLGLHLDTDKRPRRFATALVYLNTVPSGGETAFPLAGDDAAAPADCAPAGATHTRRAAAASQPESAALVAAAERALAGAGGLAVRENDFLSTDSSSKVILLINFRIFS